MVAEKPLFTYLGFHFHVRSIVNSRGCHHAPSGAMTDEDNLVNGNNRQENVRWMLRVMVNRLIRYLQVGI